MEEPRYLCGAVDEWQRTCITRLENNEVRFADMAWRVKDKVYRDCRQFYSCSKFFVTLFETSIGVRSVVESFGSVESESESETGGGGGDGDLLPKWKVYDLDEKLRIFHMIRVYCHTGQIVYTKGENIIRNLERYAAFQYYGIDGGKDVLKQLILTNLSPSNSIVAFEYAVHRHDIELVADIRTYICSYAFLVLRHKALFSIGRHSMNELIRLCSDDRLNVLEVDLFTYLYRLCAAKIGDKEYVDFTNAFDIFKFKFEGDRSLFDAVRLTSMKMDDFMCFVHKNQGAINNDDIVEIMQTIHNPKTVCRKRKKFQMVSSYPRNLNFRVADNPQADCSHWDRDMVETYFVIDVGNKNVVALPLIFYRQKQFRCLLNYTERAISVTGRIMSRTTGIKESTMTSSADEGFVKITTSVVNFRHDRWKKTSVVVNLANPSEFEIPNILSWNAIEGSSTTCTGYVFDVSKYPDYSEDGNSLMLCICVEGQEK